MTYAGFWVRLGSMLLDGLLYGFFSLIFVIPGVVLLRVAFDDCYRLSDDSISCPDGALNGGALAAGIVVLAVGVIVVFVMIIRALGRTGQTWGRKAVGIKVVSKDTGQPIGIGSALGRQLFASFISGTVCYLGYLWMLWDQDKQTWHDKVVGSVVIRV
jgi:uncharacterized RDD family membrane protein YckC